MQKQLTHYNSRGKGRPDDQLQRYLPPKLIGQFWNNLPINKDEENVDAKQSNVLRNSEVSEQLPETDPHAHALVFQV